MREFAPVPCLSRNTVIRISERFAALNPYSFGGTILKVEAVNYVDEHPRKPFRDLYGYAISAKRYSLFEGKNVRKIVDSKAHGIGYLMNPVQRKPDADEGQFAAAFWQCVLQNEGISFKCEEPGWLDLPAIMRIPVSSPAVLGRLKDFCKPYDFVLAPVVRDGDLNLDEEANKPILVTRFSKKSEEWPTATYFNVRTGEPCRVTTGEPTSKRMIAVWSYRSVLNAYVNNAEAKFDGPDGRQCCSWTRGHAPENAYSGGRTSILRQGIQAETRAGSGGSRGRVQVQSLRKRACRGRPRDAPPVEQLFRAPN
jgi:hypothetical protein